MLGAGRMDGEGRVAVAGSCGTGQFPGFRAACLADNHPVRARAQGCTDQVIHRYGRRPARGTGARYRVNDIAGIALLIAIPGVEHNFVAILDDEQANVTARVEVQHFLENTLGDKGFPRTGGACNDHRATLHHDRQQVVGRFRGENAIAAREIERGKGRTLHGGQALLAEHSQVTPIISRAIAANPDGDRIAIGRSRGHNIVDAQALAKNTNPGWHHHLQHGVGDGMVRCRGALTRSVH